MTKTRLIAIFCAIIAISMLLCACDFANGNENTTESISENKTPETEKNTEEITEEATEAAKKVSYKVTVTDEDGNALTGATVQLCVGDLCKLPSPTDAQGVATFEFDEDEYSVKVTLNGYESDDYYEFPEDSTELTVVLTKAD